MDRRWHRGPLPCHPDLRLARGIVDHCRGSTGFHGYFLDHRLGPAVGFVLVGTLELRHQPTVSVRQLRDSAPGQMFEMLQVDQPVVHPFQRYRVVLQHDRHRIGGIVDIGIAEYGQRHRFRALYELDFGAQHRHQRGLAADEQFREIEAVLRQQGIEIVARHPARNIGIVLTDVRRVLITDLPQAVPQFRKPVLGIRADPTPQPVVGQDFQPPYRIDHFPVSLCRRSAGIVADHSADRAADMCRRFRADHQVVPRQLRIQRVKRDARFHDRGAGRRIDRDQPITVLAPVQHHGRIAALTGQTGAATAREHRHIVLAAHRDGGGRVLRCARQHHTERHRAVVRGIGGVCGPGSGIETHFTGYLSGEFGRESRQREVNHSATPSVSAQCGYPLRCAAHPLIACPFAGYHRSDQPGLPTGDPHEATGW